MEQIRRAGFSVPDTLVTTDPGAAADFCDKHGDVIYKSVSGVRSVVSRVTPERRAALPAVSACPTQFQRYVPGVDYRVHVVDGDLFVCELSSGADDYRYAERQGKELRRREAVVPSDCAARCLSLASNLGLRVAGIDLRRTPEGEWFCFEVNPSPGFNFFDIDGRIAKRLAKFLASARRT
jgi:glutathione synthase/RimK-type ligase-like ATP-grasp enzyme